MTIAALAATPTRLHSRQTRLELTREECVALLAHEAPSVRVHAAWHLLDHWPDDIARVAPLWKDEAIVDLTNVRSAILAEMCAPEKRHHPAIVAELLRLATDESIGPFRSRAFAHAELPADERRRHAEALLRDPRATPMDLSPVFPAFAPIATDADLPLLFGAIERDGAPNTMAIVPMLVTLEEIVERLLSEGTPNAAAAHHRLLAWPDETVRIPAINARSKTLWARPATPETCARALDLLRASPRVSLDAKGAPLLLDAFEHLAGGSTPDESRAFLGDPTPFLRCCAAFYWAAREPELVYPLLRDETPVIYGEHHSSGFQTIVATVAFRALQRAPLAREVLERATHDSALGTFRCLALHALEQKDPADARRLAVELLARPREDWLRSGIFRTTALETLARDPRPSDVPLFRRFSRLPMWGGIAVGAMEKLGPENAAAMDLLRTLATHESSFVRDRARAALAAFANTAK